MIRVTPSQLDLLETNLPGARADQAPVVITRRRRREGLPENMLEKQVLDYLAWRGFVSTRQHVGTFVPLRLLREAQAGHLAPEQIARNIMRVGEEGAADWWSARPAVPTGGCTLDGPHRWVAFFWECKAPSKKPSAQQLAWLDRRRQRGFETAWFSQFEAEDRPSPVCAPRESHVFVTWFTEYFDRRNQ